MYGYYITQKGADLMAQALLDESKVTITQCAVGDGGDAEAEKDLSRTALNNETYRKSFDIEDFYALAPDDTDTVMIECVIPSEAGELTVSEIGFFDESDNLIAYGVLKEQKVNADEAGLEYSLDIVSFIELTSEQLSVLKVDLGKANVQAISERVDEFESSVNSTVDQYKTDLNNSWNEHVQEYETKVDGKIKGIEDTLESLNLSGDMKERLETLEQSVEKYHPALDNKVSALETTTEDLSSDVGTLQTTVGNHSNSISSLQTTTDNLSDSVGTLETTTDDLSNRVKTLETSSGKAYLCEGNSFCNLIKSILGSSNTESIIFTNSSPPKGVNLTDVSRDKDMSVVAWGDNKTVYVSAYGKKIMANPSCSYMFSFSYLTYLDIDILDTSEVTNMSNMFLNCGKLTSLDLRNFNTSKVTTMSSMFNYLTSLKHLNVSSFDTSNVTDFAKMFYYTYSLKTLDLSNFNTTSATNMSCMFAACAARYLDLSNFDTSNVTNMYQMFIRCEAEGIDVSNFNTSKVTNMESMFSRCESLKYLNVSNFNTSSATNMSYMFCGTMLPYIDVTNFTVSKVTDITSMFCESRKLKKIFGNSDWTTNSAVANGDNVFGDCSSLKKKGTSGAYAKPYDSGGNFIPLTTTEERLNYLEFLTKAKQVFS